MRSMQSTESTLELIIFGYRKTWRALKIRQVIERTDTHAVKPSFIKIIVDTVAVKISLAIYRKVLEAHY